MDFVTVWTAVLLQLSVFADNPGMPWMWQNHPVQARRNPHYEHYTLILVHCRTMRSQWKHYKTKSRLVEVSPVGTLPKTNFATIQTSSVACNVQFQSNFNWPSLNSTLLALTSASSCFSERQEIIPTRAPKGLTYSSIPLASIRLTTIVSIPGCSSCKCINPVHRPCTVRKPVHLWRHL